MKFTKTTLKKVEDVKEGDVLVPPTPNFKYTGVYKIVTAISNINDSILIFYYDMDEKKPKNKMGTRLELYKVGDLIETTAYIKNILKNL